MQAPTMYQLCSLFSGTTYVYYEDIFRNNSVLKDVQYFPLKSFPTPQNLFIQDTLTQNIFLDFHYIKPPGPVTVIRKQSEYIQLEFQTTG